MHDCQVNPDNPLSDRSFIRSTINYSKASNMWGFCSKKAPLGRGLLKWPALLTTPGEWPSLLTTLGKVSFSASSKLPVENRGKNRGGN